MTAPRAMETLHQALDRLRADGYGDSVRASRDGFVVDGTDEVHRPEDLVVEEIVRFEGASNPDDEAILLALRERDGSLRAHFVSSFGIGADPLAAELVRRLEEGRAG